MLTKEEIDHVADLARINVKEEEYLLYGKQLHDILTDIDKINKVEVNTDKIMISKTEEVNRYTNDEIKPMLSKEDIFKNIKGSNKEYIEVLRMVNDD